MIPVQIKSAHDLAVGGEAVPFALERRDTTTALSIDGREIPIAAYEGAPLEVIARSIARVPSPLRALLSRIVISLEANPKDAAWSQTYGLPVLAGMGAVGSGRITIYPHGIDQLALPDGEDVFVRNLMHELGHCWSLADWTRQPSDQEAWVRAIASDPSAPSQLAALSFRNSGLPYEDAAEATALYFLVRGAPSFDAYRAAMPARFALLAARFSG